MNVFSQQPDISQSAKIAEKLAILNGSIIPEGNDFLDWLEKLYRFLKN